MTSGAVALKARRLYLLVFFLQLSQATFLKRITSTLDVRAPLCDFRLGATLANGDVLRHIKFVDIWLLWQLGLRVDP